MRKRRTWENSLLEDISPTRFTMWVLLAFLVQVAVWVGLVIGTVWLVKLAWGWF